MRYLVLIGVLAASLFAQTDWRFAHPDATLVGGLRPQAVLDSPFLASALAEATKKEPSAAMALGMAGFAGLSYWRAKEGDPGLTTETALVLTTLIGGLAMTEPETAAAVGVVTVAPVAEGGSRVATMEC